IVIVTDRYRALPCLSARSPCRSGGAAGQAPMLRHNTSASSKRSVVASPKSTQGLDFKVSARGWGYILEEHGLTKGAFDAAERLITDCRKRGLLPVDFCAEDEGRGVDHLEEIDHESVEEFAQDWIDTLAEAHERYTPRSFWDDLDVYVQMTVEKIDLKNLFAPECARFRVATTNISGWNDINRRVQIMRRFAYWERRGRKSDLLPCRPDAAARAQT